MKSYTDIEQSKKLAQILSMESVDMYYPNRTDTKYQGALPIEWKRGLPLLSQEIPCWSLAALLGVLPKRLFDSTPKRKELYLLPDLDKSYCFYRQFAVKTKGEIYLLTEGGCLVDACYEMILKLHEQKLL